MSAIPFVDIVQNKILLFWLEIFTRYLIGMAAIAVQKSIVIASTTLSLSTTEYIMILTNTVNVIAYHSFENKFKYYTNSKLTCDIL